MYGRVSAFVVAASVMACGGGSKPAGAPTTSIPAPATLDEQTAAGGKVFAERCASCHGKSGEGGDKAPGLVGPKALDDYKNAREAFDYVRGNMPPDGAGSLSEQEYWAVVAFLVKTNEIPLGDKVLGPAGAGDVKWSR
jgi:mono/diheme cytochrome c family protein